MEVEENLCYSRFEKKYPNKHSEYLRQKRLKLGKPGTNVLVSKKFYYFGSNAVDIQRCKELKHMIIDRHGCKCISGEDVNKLKRYFEKCGYRNYGVFGKPNNEESFHRSKRCY